MNNYEFNKLINKAIQLDEIAMETIVKLYEPLINKKSFLFGKVDEDLKSELYLCLIKCILRYRDN